MRSSFGLLALLVIVCFAGAAAAQGTTSRLVGIVKDAQGGIVPGATVTLTNEATGVSFFTVSTSAGTYVFEAVQTGMYTVTVELAGFRKFVATGNPVTVGEPTTMNVTLEPGGVAETIEVKAQSEVVQVSTSGNIGTNFEQKTIESLPIVGLRGRNPLDLVLTQPGVVSGANTGGSVHVHGARDRSWNYTLDGIDTNESSAGGSNFSPLRTNPDSLAEFQVLTGNQTAEFGRNSGGQVAMITRSGTNDLRGTLFYFMRRPELNANEWENNFAGLPKRQFEQDMPGFSVGGPIRRNSTFFFVNMQWLQAKQTSERTRTVLTSAARQGLWRYVIGGRNTAAGVPGASVDSSGNVLPGVSVGTYDIAANDPARRGLDPTTTALVGSAPLPNDFSVGDGLNTAGFRWVAPEEEKQFDFVTKIDHVFSPSNSMFARISKGYQNTNCDQVNTGEPVFPDGPCVVNTERSPYNWAGNWRWNPRSNMVNEFVVGQNHFTFNFANPSSDPTKMTFSLPLSLSNPQDFTVGNLRTINTYQFVDNLSVVTGGHNLKFGINFRYQVHTDERGSVAGQNVAPIANFSTGINTVDPTTFGIPTTINTTFDRPNLQSAINLMLGRIGQISQGFVQAGNAYAPGGTTFLFDAQYPELDFYAQDNWRFRPNITLDLGLRWELKGSPTNPDDLIRRPDQDVAVGQATSNTLRWVQGKLYEDDVNNIGPSIGIAWDPKNDGRSVLRGNYRLAYDRINTFVLSSTIFQSIPGITAGVANTSFGQAGGRLRDGLPTLQPTATPESFLQPPPVSNNISTVVAPDFQAPRTHAWSISFQRELWSRGTLDIAYIGRRADHLFGAYNVNQAEIFKNGFLDAFRVVKAGGESALMNQLCAPDSRRGASESGSAMVRRLYASDLTTNSVAAIAASLASRIQSGQSLPELAGLGSYFFYPFPQFMGSGAGSAGLRVIDSGDWSRYHAVEIKLSRRFADGYSYLFGYTWSQSKDTRSYDPAFTTVSTGNAQSASSTPFNIYDRSLNYALSDFDRTHVFQGQFVWELPFGQGKRWGSNVSGGTNALIGGWQLSGQMVVQTGRPFTVYGGSYTLSNVVQTPANCSDCTGAEGAIYPEADSILWYLSPEERAKLGIPGAGEFSNVGRNAFRGDGGYYLNMSISKRIDIVGSQYLEIRADGTNVTNVPIFGFPTAVVTSTTFGRVRNAVTSTARQIQLGVKYYF